MPYLNETGLAYYDPKLKEWVGDQPVKTLPSTLYPWTQTDKAGAVTCWPVGGTELKPTVDFLFTETPPAEGDKGPENPSTITGVSSVLLSQISGKNLLAYNFSSVSVPSGTTKTYSAGITVTNNSGVFSFSGTASTNHNIYITHITEELNELKIPAGTYTLSGFTAPTGAPTGADLRIQLTDVGGGNLQTVMCSNGSVTFTINTVKRCNVYLRTASGTVYPSGFTCSPQLELGDAATAFEPSTVSGYTISLGNTYYGGTLDVSTGAMTVTHVAVTPDASTVDISSAPAALPLDYADTYGRAITSADGTSLAVGSAGGTVVYKLATPQTVQLTPTQILSLSQTDKYTPRLNTVYTDASAVQVGYVKSPIREEQELTQAIVAQGGNI